MNWRNGWEPQAARPKLSASDVESLTGGLGADAVVIAASTPSHAPISLASGAVRKKGRVVLVGVVGLEFDRRPFYFKEAEFVVSCSYGPGRYDPDYEERGHDYPAAYVRWTEQRNLQAVLELMARGKLDVRPLISHRFPIDEAPRAYDLIEGRTEPYLGVLLEYSNSPPTTPLSRSVALYGKVRHRTGRQSESSVPAILRGTSYYRRYANPAAFTWRLCVRREGCRQSQAAANTTSNGRLPMRTISLPIPRLPPSFR